MMETNERLEQLISRRLDGEITAAEDRELESMISESPEARRLLESCQRYDELARSALCDALAARPSASAVGSQIDAGEAIRAPVAEAMGHLRMREGGAQRVLQRLRWGMSLAAAAALAVVIGAAVHFGAGDRWNSGVRRDAGPLTSRAVGIAEPAATTEGAMLGVDAVTDNDPPQAVNREVIGAVGEDGKTVYLLEMDHTQTAVVPAGVAF